MNRRDFTTLSAATLIAAAADRPAQGADAGAGFVPLRSRTVTIGMLIFDRMDQIDFTGPFSVLSRLPDSKLRIFGFDTKPVRDHKGLTLLPESALADQPPCDVLVVPGGPGQQELMDHGPLKTLIASQVDDGRILFSVCTGALLCGAAGVLRNRRATTHWASFHLLPYFGATAVDERVVVDGNLVSAAGITAGIDGALRLAALLRGDEAAQRIQLDIQYAPEPPYRSGTPATAPQGVLEKVRSGYAAMTDARLRTAQAYAKQSGLIVR